MPDVTLINPLPPKGYSRKLAAPPLGLAYLASFFEEREISSSIIDCQALGIGREELLRKIEKFDPAIVGVTSTTPQVEEAYKIASMIRDEDLSRLVVMGRPHVTFLDHEAIERASCDAVVRGESERTFSELVEKWAADKDWTRIRGDDLP